MSIQNINSRCDNAYKLAQEDKYEEALVVCDEVQQIPGGEIPSFRERAAILSRQGNYYEALLAIEQTILLGSSEPVDYYKKGSICFRLGSYKESAQALTVALDICMRENDDYYATATRFLRAEILKRIGDYESAITDCEVLGDEYKFFLPGQNDEKSAKQIRDESVAEINKSGVKQWKFEED